MNKRKVLLGIIFIVGFSFLSLQADVVLDIKLRFYEGIREGRAGLTRIVTSSYLQPIITASIQADFKMEKEKEHIQRVFNLQAVNLLTEADMRLEDEKTGRSGHFFRVNGNEYEIRMRLISWKHKGQFLILVNELLNDQRKNVLSTEITLLGGNAAIFGFEDRQGKPYFLSFHITGPEEMLLPPPPPPPPPARKKERKVLPPPPPPPPPPAYRKKLEKFAEGAVRAVGEIKPPKPNLLKMVRPVYPEAAKKEGVEGVVILSVRTDIYGRVEDVMVLRSIPLLDQAAIDAVKQWVYEPFIFEGKPSPVVFTVTLHIKEK